MNYKWVILWLLFFASVISYLDRSALAIVAPLIVKDMNLSPSELGIAFSSFFAGYALFCFVGGYFADKIGPYKVLTASMSVWSVFCALTAAVASIPALLVVRLVFGMGEGPLNTNLNKLVSQWFERSKQATALGLANSGLQVGGAIAGPVVGFLALNYGWRPAFVIIGGIGFLWLIAWVILGSDSPATNRWVKKKLAATSTESSAAAVAPSSQTPKIPLKTYLFSRQILVTAYAYFGYAYILYFFLSWFPSYLVTAQNLDLKTMSFVNIIPWIFGMIGLALGGWISDILFKRTGSAVLARKIVIAGGLIISAIFVALAGMMSGVVAAVALMGGSILFMQMTLSSYWAMILDIVEPARVGGVGGFMHLIANMGGIVAPAVTGFLLEKTGLFSSAFVVCGLVAVSGALVIIFCVSSKHSFEASEPQA